MSTKRTNERNPVFEQDFISYSTVPSLKSISIVNIVVTLWKRLDKGILNQHSWKSSPSPYDRKFSIQELEAIVLKILSQIPLPPLISAKISYFIRPIGLQLLTWMYCCSQELGLKIVDFVECFCFTSEGTVDISKTIKILLNRQNLGDYVSLFGFACRYCSEDIIENIWSRMSEKQQTMKTVDVMKEHWTAVLKNEVAPSKLGTLDVNYWSIDERMFSYSIAMGYVTAAKYFWHSLTDPERNKNLEPCITKVIERISSDKNYIYQGTNEFTDILCFLLSQVSAPGQQKSIFRNYGKIIIKALFGYWPWQRFLLPTLQVMWGFLDGNIYVEFMADVIQEIKEGRSTHELLKELWCNSPMFLRRTFLCRELNTKDALWKLIEIDDLDTLKIIFKDADAENKKPILSCAIEDEWLRNLIYTEKFSAIDILLETLLDRPSECNINNAKKSILLKNGHDDVCSFMICSNNWQAIEKIISWGFTSLDQFNDFKKEYISSTKVFIQLIILGTDYKLIGKFLRWYFDTDEEIDRFKKDFVNCDDYSYDNPCPPLLLHLSFCIDGWHRFKKFVKFIFSSNDDDNVNEFKKAYKQSITLFLYNQNYEFSKKYVAWCCNSDGEIMEFKKELMLSADGTDILYRASMSWSPEIVKGSVSGLLNFYSPLSKEIVQQAKENLWLRCVSDFSFMSSKYIKYRLQESLSLIDKFIQDGCGSQAEKVLSDDISDDDEKDPLL